MTPDVKISIQVSGGGGGDSKPWLIGTTDEITPAQVIAALEAQRNVIISHVSGDTGSVAFTGFVIMPEGDAIIASAAAVMEGEAGVVQLIGVLSDNSWSFGIEPMVSCTDFSLSVAGVAADAGMVGRYLTYAASNIPIKEMVDGHMDSDGNVIGSEGYVCKYTPFVKVIPGETLYYQGLSDKGSSVVWLSSKMFPVGSAAYQSVESTGPHDDVIWSTFELAVPENAAFAMFASTRKYTNPQYLPGVPFNVYRGGERIGEMARIVDIVDRLNQQIAPNGVRLNDGATGKTYALYIYDGKLTMEEVEDA